MVLTSGHPHPGGSSQQSCLFSRLNALSFNASAGLGLRSSIVAEAMTIEAMTAKRRVVNFMFVLLIAVRIVWS